MVAYEHEYASDFAALAHLAEILADLVAALHAHDSVVLTPERIVEAAGRCMPRSQHVALAVADHDRVYNAAATSDIATQIDRIRDATGQGPALDVLDRNDLVVSGDLAADPRWPQFGARVAEDTDIRSVVSYRLHLGGRYRAALSFYSNWPHAFDNLAITTGAIFSAYGSLIPPSQLIFSEPGKPNRPPNHYPQS